MRDVSDKQLRHAEGVTTVATLVGPKTWMARIAWAPDGRLIAIPSSDGSVRLWTDAGEPVRTLEAHIGGAFAAAFYPDGTQLATAGVGGVALWDLGTAKLVRHLPTTADAPFNAIAFGPEGAYLAGGTQRGTIAVWRNRDGAFVEAMRLRPAAIRHGFDAVMALAFVSRDRIAVATDNGHVFVFAIGEPVPRLSLSFGPSAATTLATHPTRPLMAVGAADGTLCLWDPETGRPQLYLEGHTRPITGVSFSVDGLIASRDTACLCLWDIDTGALLTELPLGAGHRWPPSVQFSPTTSRFVVVASRPDATPETSDRIAYLCEYDAIALRQSPSRSVAAYTSAKLVLVGDSNVGKSCLAMRLAADRYPRDEEQGTTHGLRFWPLPSDALPTLAAMPSRQRRDVMLWDMGGQDEYRLVHQLFLQDTTVALVLFDPTRGRTAFADVVEWNMRLEKHLGGQPLVKLLVGAKVDDDSRVVDEANVRRLVAECDFREYVETSALTNRGIPSLRVAIARAIDWDTLAHTSRPALFQRIRDVITERRAAGDVILHLADLYRMLDRSPVDTTEGDPVLLVTRQLAAQGLVVRSEVATGEPVLVLQVGEIERYAGSLILAARSNPRGVPALEWAAIGQPSFVFVGIPDHQRLPRHNERAVIECTVTLLLEHGICFEHEGLLVFPTLFGPASDDDRSFPHSVSLYYDFSGAIDNIYASLVAWLVLARNFGRVRLWGQRAEFATTDGGLCGLRKTGRPGGFAHLDVYFDETTPPEPREQFVRFVEEHLRANGVAIREHVTITCQCGRQVGEEVLRQRIADGHDDVGCPFCDRRHALVSKASAVNSLQEDLTEWAWALKTKIEQRRSERVERIVQLLADSADDIEDRKFVSLLHLSDLHFNADTAVARNIQWLLDDLERGPGWNRWASRGHIDYLVVSGDFTNRGTLSGFDRAYEFLSALIRSFGISAERCVLVPGNHDVVDDPRAFERREASNGEMVEVQSAQYPLRLKPFSDALYHKLLQRPYPMDYASQGLAIPFLESGFQFLTLNSSWHIDERNRRRADINDDALANVLRMATEQERDAKIRGASLHPLMRIAVWHHAVTGPRALGDTGCIEHLSRHGVRLILHGDVHQVRRDRIDPWRPEGGPFIVGAGTFGAPAPSRPESVPRLYNLIEFTTGFDEARVHTRARTSEQRPWQPWNEWPNADGIPGALPHYDISWK